MFKPISRLIHRTPWWGLLLAGAAVLLMLVLFTVPLQVLQLTERDASVAEKRAVQREIEHAVRDSGLGVAEIVLARVRQRAVDPQRQRELDRVLQDIARARSDGARDGVLQQAHDAARDALEVAQEAAQTELDAATEALEAAREARTDALGGLRTKGLDVSGAERSFDEMIKAAEAKVAVASTALDGVRQGMERLGNVPAPVEAASAPEGSASTVAGAVLDPALRDNIRQRVQSDMWRAGIGSVLILVFIPLFVVLLVAKYFIDRSHNALAYAEQQQEEAQLSHLQRQMTEARLQALQAQVEPHFLYNTLANVQALTEIDPPAANILVGHLIDYLRAALPKMRQSSSTVGQELERSRAYLNILKMRMGERLGFDIVCDDALRELPFPPMMLPTLVENAIKHGLEPKREGGHITIEVERTHASGEDRLLLKVRDNGAGLSEQETQSGTGVGLSNLRERLLGLFGTQARFELRASDAGGVEAVIDLPVAALHRSQNALLAAPASARASGIAAEPLSVWQRFWGVTRRTHSLWTLVLSRTFVVLMAVLLVLFFVVQIGLLLGVAPVVVDNLQIDGLEGKAIGSLGLFVAFGVLALVLSLVLLLLYGLGFLFVGVLVFVIGALLLGLSPVFAPLVLIGLVIYWLWRNHRNRVEERIRLRGQQRQP